MNDIASFIEPWNLSFIKFFINFWLYLYMESQNYHFNN